MSWAAFSVIEVISNQKFGAKRIGYLAASQSFSETTDVILLITNLIRKVRLQAISLIWPSFRTSTFHFQTNACSELHADHFVLLTPHTDRICLDLINTKLVWQSTPWRT